MNSKPISTAKVDDVRWGVRFTGIVQGVGFRPLVAVIAGELQLTGFVYNDSAGVYAEVQGRPGALQAFTNGVQRRKALQIILLLFTTLKTTPNPISPERRNAPRSTTIIHYSLFFILFRFRLFPTANS